MVWMGVHGDPSGSIPWKLKCMAPRVPGSLVITESGVASGSSATKSKSFCVPLPGPLDRSEILSLLRRLPSLKGDADFFLFFVFQKMYLFERERDRQRQSRSREEREK